MKAPTAASILKQLDAHRLGTQIAALAALDTTHQEEVRRALAAVKGSARIDVPKLIESVRASIAERAAREPPGQAWRYAITLMTDDQIVEFKKLVEAGNEPNQAANTVMVDGAWGPSSADTLDKQDLQPDDDLKDFPEDNSPAPRKRRSLPRRRLHGAS